MAPKHILIPKSPHWQISISPWCPKGGTATKLKYLLQFIKMYSFYWGTYIASTIQKQYFWRVYSKTQKCYPCYSLQWSFLSVPCKTRKLCEGGGKTCHIICLNFQNLLILCVAHLPITRSLGAVLVLTTIIILQQQRELKHAPFHTSPWPSSQTRGLLNEKWTCFKKYWFQL